MKASDAKKRLLQDPEFRAEYESKKLAREIARSVIVARVNQELSQVQLAELIGTKQPSIARVESGEHLPSLTFLMRISQALGVELTAPLLVKPAPVIRTQPADIKTESLLLEFKKKVAKAFADSFTQDSRAYTEMRVYAGGLDD